jgi:pilus assembly protein CpaD
MRALLIIASAALTLTACASGGPSGPLTPLARYTLQVEPGLDRIALAVHETGLSSAQSAAVDQLANRYARFGEGWLTVQGPSGDDPAASRQTYAVRSALVAAGVPAERIRVTGYDAPDPRAPVLAGFETVEAVVTNCSTERRAMRARYSNQSSLGLGCALTSNMAAQIDNPRDIQHARTMIPADSGRSAVVFANYRAGEATSTPQEQLVQGQVSKAVE